MNMTPEWKEVLTFDINNAEDEIAIQIINNYGNNKDILAEKRFRLCDISEDVEDPLHEL